MAKTFLFILAGVVLAISYLIMKSEYYSSLISTNALILQWQLNLQILPLPEYSLADLAKYDGLSNPLNKTFVAIKSRVFDVSSNEYYGPDGGYRVLATKDISVGIAKGGFNDTWFNHSEHHWKKSLNE